jgi:hypothetical protein
MVRSSERISEDRFLCAVHVQLPDFILNLCLLFKNSAGYNSCVFILCFLYKAYPLMASLSCYHNLYNGCQPVFLSII